MQPKTILEPLWRPSGAVRMKLSAHAVAALSSSLYAAASDRHHARRPASGTLGCRTSARRRSGYLAPALDISTFLDGRAESHSVVTKTPRSASSASSRSNSAFSLSGSASANLRYLAARSWPMATHLPTPYRQFKHETGDRSCTKAGPRNRSSEAPPSILARQLRLSIPASRQRNKPGLFRSERPINRFLGCKATTKSHDPKNAVTFGALERAHLAPSSKRRNGQEYPCDIAVAAFALGIHALLLWLQGRNTTASRLRAGKF